MTTSSKERIHTDAKGQFAPVQSGGENNGVASAKPRVITGADDATMNKSPADRSVKSDERKKPDGKPDEV